MSLSATGIRALTTFRKLLTRAPGAEGLSIQHHRLLLWSASLGLAYSAQASLDYRLRNAELIRSTVLDLLSELCDCVTALNEIYSGSRAPYDSLKIVDK